MKDIYKNLLKAVATSVVLTVFISILHGKIMWLVLLGSFCTFFTAYQARKFIQLSLNQANTNPETSFWSIAERHLFSGLFFGSYMTIILPFLSGRVAQFKIAAFIFAFCTVFFGLAMIIADLIKLWIKNRSKQKMQNQI